MTAIDTRYTYKARILRWVDGDTPDLQVYLDERTTDYGFHVYEQRTLWIEDRFRLAEVDTPERGQVNWAEATAFANALAPVGAIVTARTYKPLQDKYGRWLGTVWPTYTPAVIEVEGESLNAALVRAGLAKPYFGGAREN